MLLIVVVIVVLIALGSRWLLMRYASTIPASTAVPIAIVVAFGIGYSLAPSVQRQYAPPVADSSPADMFATPSAFATAGTVHASLSNEQLASLRVVPAKSNGYVDGFVHGNSPHIEKQATFARTDTGRVSGWIVDPTGAPASGVVAIIDGSQRIDETASYGLDRPDVARFLKNDRAVKVGFSIRLPLAHMKPGKHEVVIGAGDADGTMLHALDPATFTVR